MDLVVIYAYYEANQDVIDNLLYFLKHGYIDSPTITFIFVINGDISDHIVFPNQGQSNVTILRRENKGYDFQAYYCAMSQLTRSYDYYLFLNSTVRGPFLPPYINQDHLIRWYDPFINLLQSDPEIKLVGCTINVEPPSRYTMQYAPHVQSYCFVIDRACFDFLWESKLFETGYDTIYEVITKQELVMSRLILNHGWNISCLIPEFQGRDYRTKSHDDKILGNILSNCSNLGRIVHPYEVIFMKTNRGIGLDEIQSLTRHNMNDATSHKFHLSLPKFSPIPQLSGYHNYRQSSIFDEHFYNEKNRDVKKAVHRKIFKNGLDHYLQIGHKEKRHCQWIINLKPLHHSPSPSPSSHPQDGSTTK